MPNAFNKRSTTTVLIFSLVANGFLIYSLFLKYQEHRDYLMNNSATTLDFPDHAPYPCWFYDLNGDLYALGTLFLPADLGGDMDFEGQWFTRVVLPKKQEDWTHAQQARKYREKVVYGNYEDLMLKAFGELYGNIKGDKIFVDLAKYINDGNPWLEGTIGDDAIKGRWSHTSIAGPDKRGTFIIPFAPKEKK